MRKCDDLDLIRNFARDVYGEELADADDWADKFIWRVAEDHLKLNKVRDQIEQNLKRLAGFAKTAPDGWPTDVPITRNPL